MGHDQKGEPFGILAGHDFRWVHPDGRVRYGLTPPVRGVANAVAEGWVQQRCNVFRGPWEPLAEPMIRDVVLDFTAADVGGTP